ncbi:MAG: hypothetical protein MUC88_20050, partial [Planctomycetes bacterium]|nr:hypothetical protein [Planctomycetota bacterium]
AFRDGPYGFTNPAIINSYYGRWWWPEDEKAGVSPIPGSPLPWTGDYLDGLYNKITMIAYANPGFDNIKIMRTNQRNPEALLGDGYGLIRFHKKTRRITFECWPRYADLNRGDAAQYPGWPITFRMEENDGRKVFGYLPDMVVNGAADPVVQVVREADRELLYTRRIQGSRFRPHVYGPGKYTVKVGRDKPDAWSKTGLTPDARDAEPLTVSLP